MATAALSSLVPSTRPLDGLAVEGAQACMNRTNDERIVTIGNGRGSFTVLSELRHVAMRLR